MFRRDPSIRLRMIMAAQNINVSELADRSGVSSATITAIRNRPGMKPRRDTMELIAGALGVRINTIWKDA